MTLGNDDNMFAKYVADKVPDECIFFDVGCNRGEYTEMFLKLRPKATCFVFEPNKMLYNLIDRKFEEYQVYIYDKVVAEESGQFAYLHIPMARDGMASTIWRPEQFVGESMVYLPVETISLDDFIVSESIYYIDFIKIDVEGAEMRVLKGMEKILRNNLVRFIQFEYGGCWKDAGTTLRSAVELLKNFDIYDHNMKLTTVDNLVEDYDCYNFLAERRGNV